MPHGPILGSLLFILYVNHMSTHMSENSIILYADDTVLIASNSTWAGECDIMNT